MAGMAAAGPELSGRGGPAAAASAPLAENRALDAMGRSSEAARLLGAADGRCANDDRIYAGVINVRAEAEFARDLCARMGDAAYDAAHAEGLELDLDAVMRLMESGAAPDTADPAGEL